MTTPTIAIIDYKAGNLRSVQKALEKVGAKATITSSQTDIKKADAVVFPGQGANDSSMRQMRSKKLIDPIKDFIGAGKPFLGVCLGLQLLLNGSDEGIEPGLGILEGWVKQLPPGNKIPHMGWNQVNFNFEHPLLSGIESGSHFYFVHSFFVDCSNDDLLLATCHYGHPFAAAIQKGNIIGLQFHPEKSHHNGLRVIGNFIQFVRDGLC